MLSYTSLNRLILFYLVFLFTTLSFCQNDSLTSNKNCIGGEVMYFNRLLYDQDYEFIINYQREILSVRSITLKTKIGLGLRMIGNEPDLIPFQFLIDFYKGNDNHLYSFGSGIIVSLGAGTIIPIDIAYEYVPFKYISFGLKFAPILFFSEKSILSSPIEKTNKSFIWDDRSYKKFIIALSINYHFK